MVTGPGQKFDRLRLNHNWELDGDIQIKDWSDLYYGTGNQTSASNETKLFHKVGKLSMTFRKEMSKEKSLGLFSALKPEKKIYRNKITYNILKIFHI